MGTFSGLAPAGSVARFHRSITRAEGSPELKPGSCSDMATMAARRKKRAQSKIFALLKCPLTCSALVACDNSHRARRAEGCAERFLKLHANVTYRNVTRNLQRIT